MAESDILQGNSASHVVPSPELPCVLLVDDQPARLLTYEAILDGVGVRCVRAESGEAALAQLLKQRFALMLLDVSMPGMDGFETAQLIREHPRFEKTPIIFVTGVHISELDRLKGYSAGAIDYIAVPIVPEILRSKVALLVELYRRRTELERVNSELMSVRQQLEDDQHRARTLRDSRSTALLRLSDQFRSLHAPIDIAYAASEILGEAMAVDRCGYGTVDAKTETVLIERTWNAPDMTGLSGTLKFRDFGNYIENLKRGESVACADVATDPRTFSDSSFRSINTRAFVNMPITEHGTMVAVIFLTTKSPRNWTEEDLRFIQEVAERTRNAVERRRNERALASELEMTHRLRDIAARVVLPGSVQALLEEILEAAISIASADAGTLQLFDESTRTLRFAAHRGLHPALIKKFDTVGITSKSSCGIALVRRERVFTDFDIPLEEDFDGSARAHSEHGLLSAQSTPLFSRTGTLLGMFSTHWRRRERLDDRQLRALDLLARQAADFLERNRAEETRRETDRRKDEFIAMLAHELRNPLVPIRNGIQLLKSARAEDVVPRIQPMMERQISHMVRLLDDLLDVSRITQGKIELHFEPVMLSQLLGNAIEVNRQVIEQKNLSFQLSLQHPEIELNVDPTRLTQVFSNLLQNAAKFTPPHGWIHVESDIDRLAGVLTIKVSDSGIGIEADMLPRIFELFVQADTSGRRPDSGLGLGLALARQLIMMHGGTIEATSPGRERGSEFLIRLPLAQRQLHETKAPVSESERLKNLRALVVDDNRDSADSIALILESAGAWVQAVYDGQSALDQLAAAPFDVLILDIGMPNMDGYEVCRRVRGEFETRIKIVALTGWGSERDRRNALEAGFDAHLTKPADPVKLEKLVLSLYGSH